MSDDINPYAGIQPTAAEYEQLGRAFVASLGTLVLLGHRNGAEIDRYVERTGDEFRDLAIDALLVANLQEKGDDARSRVEAWVLARRIDALVADAISEDLT